MYIEKLLLNGYTIPKRKLFKGQDTEKAVLQLAACSAVVLP